MGTCFLYGNGGGTNLNFKVVGGTTQPTSPTENMIWVNTSAEITSWIFSVTKPSSPSNGMVWIGIDHKGDIKFNALKNNTLMVYFNLCRQYIDGDWIPKDAQIYQNSTWITIESKIYLYNNGSTFSIWEGTGSYTPSELVMTTKHAKFGGSYQSSGWMGTTEKIRVPLGASYLYMTYSVNVSKGKFSDLSRTAFGLRVSAYGGSSNSNHEGPLTNFCAFTSLINGTNVTVCVPIPSSLTGDEYYIGFQANTSGSNKEVVSSWTVHQIWVE